LHHAEPRPEGRLAQEFGVDSDEGVPGKALAGMGEVYGTADKVHRGFLAKSIASDTPLMGDFLFQALIKDFATLSAY
jgi:hypothetical protein